MTHNAAHFNPRKRPPSSTSIAGPAKGNNLTGSLAVSGGSGGSRILQFQDLFKSGLFDSCFFLMNLEKSENGYFESSSENILYADLLVKKGQVVYALKYYERGIKMIHSSHLESAWAAAAIDRFIDKCLEAGDFYKAKQFIESTFIQEQKSIKRLRQLATIYDHFGEIKNAIETYKAIVKIQPLAVEAVQALIDYGCSVKEMKALDITDPTISKFSNGLSYLQTGSFSAALESFISLTSTGGIANNNVQSLMLIARVQSRSGDAITASHTYSKIRRLDGTWLQDMDSFARLLFYHGDVEALQKLSDDISSLARDSPEAWVSLALVQHLKGKSGPALEYLDRALLLDSRHLLAHQIKGKLLLDTDKAAEACASFRNAYRICRDIFNYEGLVECYLELGKTMEATSIAKEALALMPLSARAVCLAGRVMMENPSLHNKAREYLEKALKMNPRDVAPLFTLSELYTKQENLSKAIQLLEDNLPLHHVNSIHVRLGDLYVRVADYSSATHHYNSALMMNPDCVAAKEGLAEVERLVNGGDEDDLESGDEEDM